jgi:hypothetical protein
VVIVFRVGFGGGVLGQGDHRGEYEGGYGRCDSETHLGILLALGGAIDWSQLSISSVVEQLPLLGRR